MSVAFTGVKTGHTYVAGRTYVNGNGAYRANLDGSFTRLSNGGVIDGSSKSDTVRWSTTSGQTLGYGQAGREAAVSLALGGGPGVPRSSAPRSGSGAGNAGAVSSPGAPGTVAGPGLPGSTNSDRLSVRGVFLGTLAADGDINVTPVYANGRRLPYAEGWSDGADGEDRWGDFGGGLFGLAVMAADLGKGAYDASTLKGDKVVEDLEAAGWAIAEGFVEQRKRIREQERQSTLPKWITPPNVVPQAPVRYSTGGGF